MLEIITTIILQYDTRITRLAAYNIFIFQFFRYIVVILLLYYLSHAAVVNDEIENRLIFSVQ